MMNMIKKYLINKISVTTMCILLLTMFYLIPTANIQPQIDKENLNDWVSVIKLANNIIKEVLNLLMIDIPTEM